jgi:hypothetical protein
VLAQFCRLPSHQGTERHGDLYQSRISARTALLLLEALQDLLRVTIQKANTSEKTLVCALDLLFTAVFIILKKIPVSGGDRNNIVVVAIGI